MEESIQKLKLWERTTDFNANPSVNASTSTPRRCFLCQDPTHLASFHRKPTPRTPRPRLSCQSHPEPRDCHGCRIAGHKDHCDAVCMVQHPELRTTARGNQVAPLEEAITKLINLLKPYIATDLPHSLSQQMSRRLDKPQAGYPSPNPNHVPQKVTESNQDRMLPSSILSQSDEQHAKSALLLQRAVHLPSYLVWTRSKVSGSSSTCVDVLSLWKTDPRRLCPNRTATPSVQPQHSYIQTKLLTYH